MDNTTIEKNNELTELVQNSEQEIEVLSPLEEYNQSVKKRKNRILSFLILAIVECAICLAFVSGINTFDLHYRVTKQIENSLFGKNNFSKIFWYSKELWSTGVKQQRYYHRRKIIVYE